MSWISAIIDRAGTTLAHKYRWYATTKHRKQYTIHNIPYSVIISDILDILSYYYIFPQSSTTYRVWYQVMSQYGTTCT